MVSILKDIAIDGVKIIPAGSPSATAAWLNLFSSPATIAG